MMPAQPRIDDLLRQGTGVLFKKDNAYESKSLPKSSRCGHKEIVQLLSASAEVRGKELWRAAFLDNLDLMTQLLQQGGGGPDVLGYKDQENEETPLHVASQNDHLEIVTLLLHHGANVNATDKWISTPLHQASRKGLLEIVEVLINYGADVNAKEKDNWTPLHFASQKGHLEIVKALLDSYANVYTRDKWDWTPLHQASSQKQSTWISSTVTVQARHCTWPLGMATQTWFICCSVTMRNVNIRDRWHRTPLHNASMWGHVDLVRVLLQHGADAEIGDTYNKKPLQYAQDNGHADVVRLFDAHTAAQRYKVATKLGTGLLQETMLSGNPQSVTQEEHRFLVKKLEQVQRDTAGRMKVMDDMMTKLSQISWSPITHSAAELTKLVDQFDLLYAVAMDKQQDLDEQIERQAIFASKDHREFYCMLFNKLDCTVTACKSLASDMVQQNSRGSYQKWLSSLLTATSIKAILEKTPLGQLVRDSIKWATEQAPFPFVKMFGTIIHTLCSIKQEHDKYLAVARLAAFASIAEEMGGTSGVLARVTRYLVRSGRFVGKQPEYAIWQKWAMKMLAEPTTRSQAQGCLVAELVLHCIMMPCKDCPVQKILNRQDHETTLEVAIVSLVLGLSVDNVKAMEPFVTAEARQQVMIGAHSISTRARARAVLPNQNMVGVPHDVQDQEDQIAAASVSTSAPDKSDLAVFAERLRRLEEENRTLKQQVSKMSGSNDNDNANLEIDGGGGLIQMYANEEQLYKGWLEILEQKLLVTNEWMNQLTVEQIEQWEVAVNHDHDIQAQIDGIHARNNRQ